MGTALLADSIIALSGAAFINHLVPSKAQSTFVAYIQENSKNALYAAHRVSHWGCSEQKWKEILAETHCSEATPTCAIIKAIFLQVVTTARGRQGF